MSVPGSIVHSVASCGSVAVLVGCRGLVTVVLLWSIAVVAGRCGLVAMGRMLCWSVSISLSLWVDWYI